MKYLIEFDSAAARELKKLPEVVREKIIPIIDALADNPRPTHSEKMQGKGDFYKIRSGNYRVVYAIEKSKLVVVIVRVAHRREVYKRRK